MQAASHGPSDEHTGHGDPGGAASLGHHDAVVCGPCLTQQTCRGRVVVRARAGLTERRKAREGDQEAVESRRGSRAVGTVGRQLGGRGDPKPNRGKGHGLREAGDTGWDRQMDEQVAS